jgi:hypothetical protein
LFGFNVCRRVIVFHTITHPQTLLFLVLLSILKHREAKILLHMKEIGQNTVFCVLQLAYFLQL